MISNTKKSLKKQRQAEFEKQQELNELQRKKELEHAERIKRERQEDAELNKRTEHDWYNRSTEEAVQAAQAKASEKEIRDGNACVICHKTLKDTGPFIRKDGQAIHRACLKCSKCQANIPVSGSTIIANEGKILCGNCSGGFGGNGVRSNPAPSGKEVLFCPQCNVQTSSPTAKFCASCGCKFN